MLDEDDISLFRAEIKGVKKLKQDTFLPPRQNKKKAQIALKDMREQQDTLFYFSDEYEPFVETITTRGFFARDFFGSTRLNP